MTGRKPFPHFEWDEAVWRSDVDPTDRLVLLCLPKWINWTTLELWPSMGAIADAAGLTARTVGLSLDRLARRGVLEFLIRSRGGRSGGHGVTHRLRVHPDALAPKYPEGDSEYATHSNPEAGAGLPRTARVDTPKPASKYPEAPSEEPSMHPSGEPTREPSTRPTRIGAPGGGCMDAPSEPASDLRTALARAGIRGANLELLSGAPGLTVEAVERERRAVEADRSVRNPAAVLARRLADVAGVALKLSRRLDPQTRSAVAEIENLRRRKGPPADPTKVGAIRQREPDS